MASAVAALTTSRSLAAKAAGRSAEGAAQIPWDGQSLVELCGLQDAPWLNAQIAAEFDRFQPGWAARRAKYLAHWDSKRSALIERQQQGFTCPIADQILAEGRWLANATTEEQRILARLAEFDEAFGRQRDMYNLPPLEQAEDGSWAPYVTEPFHKLDISIDYINRIVGSANPIIQRCIDSAATPRLRRPLAFLQHWSNPDTMIEELSASRWSAIHLTGRWNRQKYGSLLSSLAQLMLKDRVAGWLRDVAQDTTFTDEHKIKFVAFLDAAQDPCTGCWRDGYRFLDGTSHEAFDLSNLYHIVQYRREGIKHWDAIADGLVAVRRFRYPQGPLGPAYQPDDHNDYDALRIALRCLDDADPRITPDRSARLQGYVREIALGAVERLRLNFPVRGSASYPSTVAADCYRVQLLDQVGFWSGQSRFLAEADVQDRRRLAEAMLRRLIAYDDPAPMPVYAIALLRSHLGSC